MQIKKRQYPDTAIFHLTGRLDSSTTETLEEEVISCLDQGIKYLILDFANLEYINSAGLRILVLSHQRLHPNGGQVMVCSPRDYIAEIFNISGYDKVFTMFGKLEEALRQVQIPEQ